MKDGSSNINVRYNATIQGRSAGTKVPGANTSLASQDTFASDTAIDGIKANQSTFNAGTNILFPNKQENPFHKYNTFNTIFTLACLTLDEINFPYKLRVDNPEVTILRSGGSGKSKLQTPSDLDFSGGVSGAKNTREFFIGNVDLTHVFTATQANGTADKREITFSVYEPYSIGVFIETIRLAAVKAGYKNYNDAPYALIIEFIGTDINGNRVNIQDDNNSNTKRIIPIRWTSIDFSADASGATYDCKATQNSDYAMMNSVRMIPHDVTIRGLTVSQFLQSSLQAEFNKVKQNKADDFIVNFPKESDLRNISSRTGFTSDQKATQTQDDQKTTLVGSGGTVVSTPSSLTYEQPVADMNAIGTAKMNFADNQFKSVLNDDQKQFYDILRKGISMSRILDPRLAELTFKKGSSIENIITNVILFSDYVNYLLDDSDADGFKQWFKVIPRVYYINDQDVLKKTGNHPKFIVYDVVEYKVHESFFAKPNKKTITDSFNKFVVKEYDYLYTGKNLDVMKFDIRINNSFTAFFPQDQGESKQDPNKTAVAKKKVSSKNDTSTSLVANENIPTGKAVSNFFYSPTKQVIEATGELTTEQKVALEMHDFFMTGQVSLNKIEMEILGDPYYLSDSGTGNYLAQSVDSPLGGTQKFINKDGSMESNFNGVFIVINFRTPIDYGPNGQMFFKDNASQLNENFIKLHSFSGVYQLYEVASSFNQGQFTQTLRAARVVNQEASNTISDDPEPFKLEENPEME